MIDKDPAWDFDKVIDIESLVEQIGGLIKENENLKTRVRLLERENTRLIGIISQQIYDYIGKLEKKIADLTKLP